MTDVEPAGGPFALEGTATSATRWNSAAGAWETTARGHAVLSDPRLARGAAFTQAERDALGLTGLLPPQVLTLEEQTRRAYGQLRELSGDTTKHTYLSALQERNETLFYRLLLDHLTELLPIVYTPTIGEAIRLYSREFRRPQGCFLSVDHPEDVERSLLACGLRPDDVDLVVATDAQAILGIGDWGIGGIDIAIGKLTVYTAAAGIDPARTLPVMLDVGTDRRELLEDPLYLGCRHERVTGADYDAFIDHYVHTARRLFPSALLHWEDFAAPNARRILARFRDETFTFNDDIQGTGSVNLAAVLAGARASATPLVEHRIVIFGAGTAGVGIADQLCAEMVAEGLDQFTALSRFWCVDRMGLLTTTMSDLREDQTRFARDADEVADWSGAETGAGIVLAEVVRRVHPTILIGTSAQPGAFSEPIIRDMARHVKRPVILPMSNPNSLCEANPRDLISWTDGRALVATGSPFLPVTHQGVTYTISQVNNALVFPGLALGALLARADRITDHMLATAAHAVAGCVDAAGESAVLLPRIADLRSTSAAVAFAVAQASIDDGVAHGGAVTHADVAAAMWWPRYRPIHAV
ncbi:NAD-dependent malic enzyme [Streptomyces vinaceus]|uniref:NAD-dependent malic enzyme n=1 Tax=Streptomyces vinaceus TaxID=1960 RepID=UPI0037FEF609